MKLLTYNVALLEYKLLGYSIFSTTPYNKERIQCLPEMLKQSGADIIALQEVYSLSHKEYIIKALREDYPFYSYKHGRYKFAMENSLLTFFKEEFIQSDHYSFKNCFLEERFLSKLGMTSSKIEWSGKQVGLFNIHLTAGGFKGPEHKRSESLRSKQIEEVINYIKNYGCEENIIVGDLNCGPGISDHNFQIILDNGFNTTDKSSQLTWDPKNNLNQKGIHSHCPAQCIDHILITDGLMGESTIKFTEAIVKGKESFHTVSDHYGVFGNLSFMD